MEYQTEYTRDTDNRVVPIVAGPFPTVYTTSKHYVRNDSTAVVSGRIAERYTVVQYYNRKLDFLHYPVSAHESLDAAIADCRARYARK